MSFIFLFSVFLIIILFKELIYIFSIMNNKNIDINIIGEDKNDEKKIIIL